MNKQEMEQKALAMHVSDINDTMHQMIKDLTSEIAKREKRQCLCQKCERSFRQMVSIAYTFRHDFLDKHPGNYPHAEVKPPYNILLAKQLYEKINEALVLAPVLIPWMLFEKWNKSLLWLENSENNANEESHEDIKVQ